MRVQGRTIGGRGCRRVPGRARARGFTLTELMIVVLITGVLAVLGFVTVQHHVSTAWGAEALNMVQSIRAAQERWRAEHMMYLDVSTDDAWYPVDPRLTANRRKKHPFFYPPGSGDHGDNELWLMLRPIAPGPVRFGYLVNAGHAGEAMTEPAFGPSVTWPEPDDNWYVIQAIGDVDWDGSPSYYRASSLSGEVFAVDHGE